MGKRTDIGALKREWKNLFTYWHLSGGKEGGWRCMIGNQMAPVEGSLETYLNVFHSGYEQGAVSGFTGVQLFYSNGTVSLAACCGNESHYTFFGNVYTRVYSEKEYLDVFRIQGITPSIQKRKECDYLLLEGTLSAFETSEFYADCRRIYEARFEAKQEKEALFQSTVDSILEKKERIHSIYESPLVNLIQGFERTNHFSFWDCNTFTVTRNYVHAKKSKGINWWDDSCWDFKFDFRENGYENLSYDDSALLAAALILKRYELNPGENEGAKLRELLTQAHFECGKEQICFIYCELEEKLIHNLKGILE